MTDLDSLLLREIYSKLANASNDLLVPEEDQFRYACESIRKDINAALNKLERLQDRVKRQEEKDEERFKREHWR